MDASARRLEMLVGYACNNRCRFCAEEPQRDEACGTERERREASDLLERLERLRRLDPAYRHLTLLGGEPTLHPAFAELVAGAVDLGFEELFVTTNGRLLGARGFLPRIPHRERLTWCVSIHGPDAATHDALTRARGSFRQSLDGLERAAEAGGRAFATTTVVRQNVARLPDTVARLVRAGARHVHVAFVRPMGAAAADFERLVPPMSELAAVLTAAVEAAGRVPLRVANLPLCLFPAPLRGLCDERRWASAAKRTVVKPKRGGDDCFEDRAGRHKAYGPPCERCRARPACEGVYERYVEHRGFGECRPLRSAPIRRTDG